MNASAHSHADGGVFAGSDMLRGGGAAGGAAGTGGGFGSGVAEPGVTGAGTGAVGAPPFGITTMGCGVAPALGATITAGADAPELTGATGG